MSQPVISVENLSKAYRLGHKEEVPDTILGATKNIVTAPWRNFRNLRSHSINNTSDSPRATSDSDDDTLWALKDVSFEINQGDVVGIIGRNGAGKSTLLKILSRITEPTSGRAVIRGRVSSLLEVGTGFHPELSGRDNVYMNGTILGMTKREIDRKFDEIVEFSGVEKFLDTPTKRYSSGMQVRLAFAVAAHLEPEILVIDEVLAVGDAEFQTKCIGKMRDVASAGRTVLFVSHNMDAVSRLTKKCVLLQAGKLSEYGETANILNSYHRSYSPNAEQTRELDISLFRRDKRSDGPAFFKQVSTHDTMNRERQSFSINESIEFVCIVHAKLAVPSASITITITRDNGPAVVSLLSHDVVPAGLPLEVGDNELRCQVTCADLLPGDYRINIGVSRQVGVLAWDVIEEYPSFSIANEGASKLNFRSDRPGVVCWNQVSWSGSVNGDV